MASTRGLAFRRKTRAVTVATTTTIPTTALAAKRAIFDIGIFVKRVMSPRQDYRSTHLMGQGSPVRMYDGAQTPKTFGAPCVDLLDVGGGNHVPEHGAEN